MRACTAAANQQGHSPKGHAVQVGEVLSAALKVWRSHFSAVLSAVYLYPGRARSQADTLVLPSEAVVTPSPHGVHTAA